MEFAIISPTAGLERYATLSKTHLVLSHQCGDPVYRDFYLSRREAGDTLILDNGSYENNEPFINPELIQYLEPNIVVLPDFLLQPWKKTWHASIAHLDKFDHEAIGFEWLYIPQAEKGDLHGFMESYLEATNDPRITWVGIPRALATDIAQDPLARVSFARLVKRERPNLRLHAFGMVNGDVHELPYLEAAGVNSIDSSAPVWRGWNQGKYLTNDEDRKWWDEHGTPVDFNAKLPLSIQDPELIRGGARNAIQANLEACGVRIPNR